MFPTAFRFCMELLTHLYQQAKAAPPKLSDVKDLIDESTFEQILEMDDDDDCDFSRGIVYGFFDQAKSTFTNIKTAL